MTQISRKPLRKDVWDRLFSLYIDTFSSIKDKNKFKDFANDFFTPTEKIMFAKRLGIAVLLAKGHDYDSIKGLLKVTPATIAKMSLHIKYGGKGLKPVIDDIFKRQASRIIWEEIKSLLDMPRKQVYSKERIKRSRDRKSKIDEFSEEF